MGPRTTQPGKGVDGAGYVIHVYHQTDGGVVSLEIVLITAVGVGGLAGAVVLPTDPDDPWPRRLTRLVPLALIVGVVLAWASSR